MLRINKMQLAIELPDELVFDIQKLLKQQDIKQFAQEAVKSAFLNEQHAQQQQKFMDLIHNMKPIKAPYSSEEMIRFLREGKEDHLMDEIKNHAK